MQRLEDELKERYEALDGNWAVDPESAIDPSRLLTFPYDYPGSEAEVSIETDEFTAVCPWTGLPDLGTLTLRYVPGSVCLELKSLKYYLLTFRNVGIVQEHAANRILRDLVAACAPVRMFVRLDYRTRGGIHTVVNVSYHKPDAS